MSETKNYVICDKSDLVAVGDAVRSLIGSTDVMNLSDIKSNVNTAKSDVDNAFTALEAKGITVPSGSSVSDIASLIEGIETSGVTIAFGTYTPTTTTKLTIPCKIDHNLGYIPDIFFLYACASDNDKLLCIVARYKDLLLNSSSNVFGSYCAGKGSSNIYEGVLTSNQPTVSSIWVRSSSQYHNIKAGQTYRWFAVGGLS